MLLHILVLYHMIKIILFYVFNIKCINVMYLRGIQETIYNTCIIINVSKLI